MKNIKTLKNEGWDILKEGHYWNLLLVNLLVGLILGVTNIFSIIIAGPLMLGLSIMYLKVFRFQTFKFEELFSPFTTDFVRSLTTYLLKALYIFLWSLLLIIPGIIKTFSYAMTEYILADNEELTADEAITKSRELMDGHKMRLFLLYLSFIGWILLSILTLGIGLIFLMPYVRATETAFYLDLINDPINVKGKEIEEVEVIIEQ